MPWAVTLQITDCEQPDTNLAFAFVADAFGTYTADANGQIIWIVDDSSNDWLVDIWKAGYLKKTFALHVSQQGKVQDVCLNPEPPEPEETEDPDKKPADCTIGVAAAGTPQSKKLDALRQLRDRVRAVSTVGASLIDAIYREYWQFSPAIAAELQHDPVRRQLVREVVVQPLVAWYALAGKLGLERAGEATIRDAVRQVAEACPSGTMPDPLGAFAPQLREARAQFPFASWAILDPLLRVWSAVQEGRDVVEDVARWLASAPIESFDVPAHELEVLSGIMAFHPDARRQLVRRLGEST